MQAESSGSASTSGPTRSKLVLFALLPTVLLVAGLVAAELSLRALGWPSGIFRGIPNSEETLWPAGWVLQYPWGARLFTFRINRDGFRGPELSHAPPAARPYRVAMLGDSLTLGYFVADEHTYPVATAQALSRRGCAADVVNAGIGAVSIDTEFRVYREFVAPLEPDLAVLTVCSNDLADLGDRPREALMEGVAPWLERVPADGTQADYFHYRLTNDLALGELGWDWTLRYRYDSYRAFEGPPKPRPDPQATAKDFLRRFAETDGLALEDPLSPAGEDALGRYLEVFDALRRRLEADGVRLAVVDVPAYPQIYLDPPPGALRRRLAEACAARGVPCFDPRDALRRAGQEEALHLAPVDFHFNEVGNRVLGESLAEFLHTQGLLAGCSGNAPARSEAPRNGRTPPSHAAP